MRCFLFAARPVFIFNVSFVLLCIELCFVFIGLVLGSRFGVINNSLCMLGAKIASNRSKIGPDSDFKLYFVCRTRDVNNNCVKAMKRIDLCSQVSTEHALRSLQDGRTVYGKLSEKTS